MDIKKLSDEDLVEEFKCYWDRINTITCYSTRDVLILDALEREISDRGFEIVNKVDVLIPDGDEE